MKEKFIEIGYFKCSKEPINVDNEFRYVDMHYDLINVNHIISISAMKKTEKTMKVARGEYHEVTMIDNRIYYITKELYRRLTESIEIQKR